MPKTPPPRTQVDNRHSQMHIKLMLPTRQEKRQCYNSQAREVEVASQRQNRSQTLSVPRYSHYSQAKKSARSWNDLSRREISVKTGGDYPVGISLTVFSRYSIRKPKSITWKQIQFCGSQRCFLQLYQIPCCRPIVPLLITYPSYLSFLSPGGGYM